MKMAFYAPFKPLGHKNPSGDLVIAQSLVDFLTEHGHDLQVQSRLRTRWIYLKPWLWPLLLAVFIKISYRFLKDPPDLWLTYHTYYKSPDVLGPWICKLFGLRYVIFQGIYSTKQKRKIKTRPGFYLNRAALRRADHVLTNKTVDLKNLKRLLPGERVTYIKPGLLPQVFEKDRTAGSRQRRQWCTRQCPVILTAAMFRDDVKTQGLAWLIRCLGKLVQEKTAFHLVIAGSGKMEVRLKELADLHLPGHHTFAGKIKRDQMPGFYSAGDIFAFPGINESLGMVFLEAQSCGLPVVAFDNAGIPEVVVDHKTGFLVPMYDETAFLKHVRLLLSDKRLCRQMGEAAADYVRKNHHLKKNYKKMAQVLQGLAS